MIRFFTDHDLPAIYTVATDGINIAICTNPTLRQQLTLHDQQTSLNDLLREFAQERNPHALASRSA